MVKTRAIACNVIVALSVVVAGVGPAAAGPSDGSASLRMRPRPAQSAPGKRPSRQVAQAPAPGQPPADHAGPAPGPEPVVPGSEPAHAAAAPVRPPTSEPKAEDAELSEAEFAKIAEQQTSEEIIIVTGSTIGRKTLTTPAPLTILDRELLTSIGQTTLGDALQQELPVQQNAPNAQVNLGGDGTTRVNLRGLGMSRTLTLINGRRMVSGGWGANTSVDLNAIPLAIVERVEVLKDGASAVYGSDAVGGVVNIITRSDYEGSEATIFSSASQRAD